MDKKLGQLSPAEINAGWKAVKGGGDWAKSLGKSLGKALSCPNPNCGHQPCSNCRKRRKYRPLRWSKRRKDWFPDLRFTKWMTPVICCQCTTAKPLQQWLGWPEGPFSEPCTISKNEYDRKKIALESEVERGIISREEAEEEIGQWTQRSHGGYIHQDEILRRLAGGEKEGK